MQTAFFDTVAKLPISDAEQINDAVVQEESRVVKVCLVLYKCLVAGLAFLILVLLLIIFGYSKKAADVLNGAVGHV